MTVARLGTRPKEHNNRSLVLTEDLAKLLDRTSDMVVDVVAYRDTVDVLSNRYFKTHELNLLTRACLNRENSHRYDQNHSFWVDRFIAQRPTDEFFELLDDWDFGIDDGGRFCLSRVHIANDLTTRKTLHARSVGIFMDACLIKQWHGKQRRRLQINTVYSALDETKNSKVSNVLVHYSDRRSKETGDPCCHIECRMNGAEAVKSAGFNKMVDLIDPDFRAFFDRRMVLYRLIDPAALGRAYRGNKNPTPYDHDLGVLIKTLACIEDGHHAPPFNCAQSILDYMRDARQTIEDKKLRDRQRRMTMQAFIRVPHEVFLPE